MEYPDMSSLDGLAAFCDKRVKPVIEYLKQRAESMMPALYYSPLSAEMLDSYYGVKHYLSSITVEPRVLEYFREIRFTMSQMFVKHFDEKNFTVEDNHQTVVSLCVKNFLTNFNLTTVFSP